MSEVIESNDAAMPPEQKYFVEAAKRKRSEGTKQFEQLHFSDNDRLAAWQMILLQTMLHSTTCRLQSVMAVPSSSSSLGPVWAGLSWPSD